MPPSKVRSIPTFEAKCAECRATFAAPLLSDSSYGELLFFGELGTAYAYLEAIGHPIWHFVAAVVGKDGDAIRHTLAILADPVAGQPLCDGQVCPTCHSRRWEYWGGARIGSADVAAMTFEKFARLTDDQRRDEIRRVGRET